jgi:branched-chain amino acid transport system permease protein
MDQLTQQLIIGLSVGATYSLIALGYTMVYGVLKLINFAHGEVYMVGAISGYYISTRLNEAGAPVWLMLILTFAGAMILCAILGFAIEFFAYRPLRNSPRLVALITAIGVSLLLQNVALIDKVFGPTPHYYPRKITEAVGDYLNILGLIVSLVLMVILTLIVYYTRIGLALRAVSHRVDTSALMGINSNRIISYTFMLGSSLAAVAGVFDGIRYKVYPLMGLLFGLKAFVAAVLGGIGSIPGALIGGLLIGLIETFVKTYLSTLYADAVVFSILILILLIKPTGLLGKVTPEKV